MCVLWTAEPKEWRWSWLWSPEDHERVPGVRLRDMYTVEIGFALLWLKICHDILPWNKKKKNVYFFEVL